MKPCTWVVIVVAVWSCAALVGVAADSRESGWPAWRGPLATGASPDAVPPLHWDESTNVLWKTAIPGRGVSTPIVWKDRVFLTTAVETDKAADPETVRRAEVETPEFVIKSGGRLPAKVIQFTVLALKRSDGSVLWKQIVCEEVPHEGTHADGSWASSSPATDGERLYVYFGSYGLYCFDLDGKKVWEKRLGRFKMKARFGEGVSPVLCGEQVIVSQDQEGPGFLAAFDRKTGEDVWRVPRNEVTSWATPLVLERDGKRQIVVSASKRIRSYDATNGAMLWEIGGMTDNVIPSPVADAERVYCLSGFRGNALLAIRQGAATGDITDKAEALAWKSNKNAPYVPSPLLADGRLYYFKANDAALNCVDAATGKELFGPQIMEGCKGAYASPVAAAGRVYATARNGITVVLKAGEAYTVLASNPLDDSFTASAALAGKDLFLRGLKSLYCIAEKPE
jgi:outer membrane protein assembly factor BamB